MRTSNKHELPETMKSIQISRFGGPDVMEVVDTPLPVVKEGELLIRLKAASINPVDIQVTEGEYAELSPLPFRVGFDGAGIVISTAENDSKFKVGDEVFFVPRIFSGEGTYSQYCTVNREYVAHKPKNISFVEAAALSLVGSTAIELLVERARLQYGEVILVHGGSGGVGSASIQVAKAIGAKVIATSSRSSADYVKSLGADYVVAYDSPSSDHELTAIADSEGINVILDTIGGNCIEKSGAILSPFGRLISIADFAPPQDLSSLWSKNAEVHFVYITQSGERLEKVRALVEDFSLIPNIERTFAFEEAEKAYQYMEDRGRKGKVVLTIN